MENGTDNHTNGERHTDPGRTFNDPGPRLGGRIVLATGLLTFALVAALLYHFYS